MKYNCYQDVFLVVDNMEINIWLLFLKIIRAYWSERRVVTNWFFSALVTTQEFLHGATTNSLYLSFFNLQSYKSYLNSFQRREHLSQNHGQTRYKIQALVHILSIRFLFASHLNSYKRREHLSENNAQTRYKFLCSIPCLLIVYILVCPIINTCSRFTSVNDFVHILSTRFLFASHLNSYKWREHLSNNNGQTRYKLFCSIPGLLVLYVLICPINHLCLPLSMILSTFARFLFASSSLAAVTQILRSVGIFSLALLSTFRAFS